MNPLNGDVLAPVLITLLVVNLILIVRAVARRQLGRRNAETGGSPMEPEVAHQVAPTPTQPGPADAVPEPGPADAVPEPGPADVRPAPPTVGRDQLTGLDDRAAWDRRVADESARARRYRRPATIVSIELDGLDRLEELLGEDAGDRLVRAMADTLRRLARDTDAIARVGRGGFAVLMPETSADAATRYVERVSRACELWLESAATTVRLAIGWAAGSGDVDLAEIERLAIEVRRVDEWRDAHRGGTGAEQGPDAKPAGLPPMPPVEPAEDESAAADEPTVATSGLDPRRPRGHKKDHRRNWHR